MLHAAGKTSHLLERACCKSKFREFPNVVPRDQPTNEKDAGVIFQEVTRRDQSTSCSSLPGSLRGLNAMNQVRTTFPREQGLAARNPCTTYRIPPLAVYV
jgi:hypothetical protein